MDLEAVKTSAGRLLAPVPGATPAGQNASFDPRYESLRNTMASLDSPSGGEGIEWRTVVTSGEELLQGTSKDLLVAAYTTYAMMQTQGLPGLATGLQAILGLFEQYWDTMFPPAARMRGRGNALDWLVARLELALPSVPLGGGDRPLIDLILAQWKDLGAKSRELMGDHSPSMRGVEEVLQRIQLKLPAAAPAAAPPPAAAPTPEAAPTRPAPLDPAPPGPIDGAPAAAPTPAPAPAPTPAPAAPAPADPIAELQAKAQPWLEPIRPDAPAGTDARFDPEFEEAKSEIAKLDSISGEPPNWAVVLAKADSVLKNKAKDILIACYFAFARYKEKGLAELPLGLLVLDGVLDKFSEGAFPTRPRGRGNAASWLVDQLMGALAEQKLQPTDRPTVLGLDAAIKRLSNTMRERLEDEAPGTRELNERVTRMLLAVPEAKPEPPKPPPPTTSQPTPAAARPAQATATAAAPMPGVAEVGSAADVEKFALETGRALIKAATLLRATQVTNPTAYRLLRTGLWLHLVNPPPADAGGKTQIPALPPPRRQQFDTMLANKIYPALIEETESMLQTQRFNIDLHRLSWVALDGMGSAADPAKIAITSELRAFLTRMPQLLELKAADGSPLADGETRAWLGEHVLTGGGGGGGSGASEAADIEALAPARASFKDKPTDAMKLARAAIAASPSPRSRLVRQLILAEICLGAGQTMLARGMFAGLDRELRERGLLQWEPDLAGRCLEGFVRAIRTAQKAGNKYDGADEVFERLCMVDPAAAARVAG